MSNRGLLGDLIPAHYMGQESPNAKAVRPWRAIYLDLDGRWRLGISNFAQFFGGHILDRRTVLKGGLASAALISGGAMPLMAAPKAVLWERWTAHDPNSTAIINHDVWRGILSRYLVTGSDGLNRFAYGKVSSDDSQQLQGYLETLIALPISSYNRPEQMAYWINLYNALTIKIILDYYYVESIRDIDISPGLFSDGPWGKKLLSIERETLSLDDIEHQILRPIWQDPRIHYAVNCASIGCPNLQPRPFTAAELDRDLDQAAIDYVNNPRGVAFIGEDLIVSSIYEWFKEDFGGNDKGVIAHLKGFAAPPLAVKLEGRRSIDGDEYNWLLNDASSAS